MNEKAIQHAYDLFVIDGYNGTIEDFKQLIASNPKAYTYAYTLFQNDGYADSPDDFGILMGLKKKEEPVLDLPSEDGLSEPQEIIDPVTGESLGFTDPVVNKQVKERQEEVKQLDPRNVELHDIENDINTQAAIESGSITKEDLIRAGYYSEEDQEINELLGIKTENDRPTEKDRLDKFLAQSKIKSTKQKTDDELDLEIQEKNLDTPYFYQQFASDDNFVDETFGNEQLILLNINPKDFDGFITKMGYKQEYIKDRDNGLFDTGFRNFFAGNYGQEDTQMAGEIRRNQMLQFYINHQFKRDIDFQKIQYYKRTGINPDYTDEQFIPSQSNVKVALYDEYMKENMPILTRKMREKEEEEAKEYQKVLNGDKGGLEYFGDVVTSTGQGFVSRLNNLSSSFYDMIGADVTAEAMRIKGERENLFSKDFLSYGYKRGKKVIVNGRQYLVDEYGQIFDTEIKRRVTKFLDPMLAKQIRSEADKTSLISSSTSGYGLAIQTGNVVGDLAVQIGATLATRRGLSGLANVGGNIKGLNTVVNGLNKLPISRSMSASIIAQGTLGMSNGYETTLKAARDAGIKEEDARELALEAGKQMGILYSLTAPIAPQTKAVDFLRLGGAKSALDKAIKAYKTSGIKGFQKVWANTIQGAKLFRDEGLKEMFQENVQVSGEKYIVNPNINKAAGQKLLSDTYSLEEFVNTSILSFLAGGLMPVGSKAISSTFQSTRTKLGLDAVDKFKTLSYLSQNEEKVTEMLNQQVNQGLYTRVEADNIISDMQVFKNSVGKIPSDLSPETGLEIMQDLNKITVLENKKKTQDPAFHKKINDEIQEIRENIQNTIGQPEVTQETVTPPVAEEAVVEEGPKPPPLPGTAQGDISTKPVLLENAPEGTFLNVGMIIGKDGGTITQADIKKALPKDVKIIKKKKFKKGEVGLEEPTLSFQTSRPLTDVEMKTFREATKQLAIPQVTKGIGNMYGTTDYGDFNPDYFIMPDGKRLSETATAVESDLISRSELEKQVENSKSALSKLAPDVNIEISESEQNFILAAEQSGVEGAAETAGFYDPNTKRIVINPVSTVSSTVAHETAHAIFDNVIGSSKEIQAITKEMLNALSDSDINPEFKKELEQFASNYDENFQNEERVVELIGQLAAQYSTLSNTGQNIIQKWLDKLAKLFGLKQFTKQEAIDVLNTMAGKISRGEAITEQDVKPIAKKKTETEGSVAKKQIIGQNAVLSRNVRENLNIARNMEVENKDPKTIKLATGWEKGKDGKWRYEIFDGEAKFKKETPAVSKTTYKLDEYLDFPELYQAYPDAKDIDVRFGVTGFYQGAFFENKNLIEVDPFLESDNQISVLIHEIQHFIQQKEGFGRGVSVKKAVDIANDLLFRNRVALPFNFIGDLLGLKVLDPKYMRQQIKSLNKAFKASENERGYINAYEMYRRALGETEARNAEFRRKMSPELRRQTLLEESEDIARDEQYVIRQIFDPKKAPSVTSKVADLKRKSNEALQNRIKKRGLKERSRIIREKLLDRQTRIKDLLKGIGSKEANKANNLLVTKAGASGYGDFRFKEADKKIFQGLSAVDQNILDEIVYSKRIIAINENRKKQQKEGYTGVDGYNQEDATKDLDAIKATVGEEKFNDLTKRADDYFKVFNQSLKRMRDSGLISEDVYNDLKDIEYSPIKTIKYIVPEDFDKDQVDRMAMMTGMNGDVIKSLSDKNVNDVVMDSRWLLQTNISMIEARVFENRMLNSFSNAVENATAEEKAGFSEHILDNPRIGTYKNGKPKYKYDEVKLPIGFKKVEFVKDGQKKYMVISEPYAKQLLDMKLVPELVDSRIAKLTGTNILRFLATSGNPLFIVGNTAIDFANILMLSDVYSNNKFVGGPKLAFDFTKQFLGKVAGSKGYKQLYEEYMEHGGAMTYLSIDGLKALDLMKPNQKAKNLFTRTMKKWGQYMSYLGETSEVSFRLAVFEKSKSDQIKKFKKENNNEDPNEQQMEDIMFEASREARETIDFSQGGTLIKGADKVLPYLNASTQGFRKAVDYASKNPKGFASSMIQGALMAGGLTAMSIFNLFKGLDDEEEKKIIDILSSVSEYEKANYHIIFTGEKNEDGEYKYVRIKKLPVMSAVTTIAENLTIKSILESKGIDYEMDDDAISKSLRNISPIDPRLSGLVQRNPALSAYLTYAYNYDMFYDQKVFREPTGKKILPVAEGMMDSRVDQIYKDLAPKLGLSPKRTKAALEKIITSENTNPMVGLFYSGYDKLSKLMLKDGYVDPKEQKTLERFLSVWEKKLVRYTNSNLLKYKEQDELEEMEKVLETGIYLVEQEMYSIIRKRYKDDKGSFTEKELADLVVEKFEPRDHERYFNKYATYIRNMDTDPVVLDILFETTPEVQALRIFKRYGNSFEQDEIKEMNQALRAAGRRSLPRKTLDIYYKKYHNK